MGYWVMTSRHVSSVCRLGYPQSLDQGWHFATELMSFFFKF